VESVVRSLRPVLVGRTIVELIVPAERHAGEWPDTLRRLLNSPPQKLREKVAGMRISAISRMGKNIQISLSANGDETASRTLWVHLGMTGRLTSEVSEVAQSRHTHLIFELGQAAGNRRDWLHFADIRRFGRVRLTEVDLGTAANDGRERAQNGCAELGPEPLEVSAKEFAARLRARRSRIKAVLLNQNFVRGLGNIYADESLFRAGIHPQKIAARVHREQAISLHTAMQDVLREAIAAGGSSISNYVDGQGRAGWFQIHHNVYQRAGEPCHACKTPIRRIIVAGRSSHFCPGCQRGRVTALKAKGVKRELGKSPAAKEVRR
jgi:formamidopyrimidine-DNA glycosylase